MTDAELSLADSELSLMVARIMWPEYEWKSDSGSGATQVSKEYGVVTHDCESFDHTTDDALGKMCVWLGKETYVDDDVHWMLRGDNPNRAIAEAIVEVGKCA